MTIDIFVLKGDLNGENRSGAFLFFVGYIKNALNPSIISRESIHKHNIGQNYCGDLEHKVNVTKIFNSFLSLNNASIQVWWKSTHWFRRKRTKKGGFIFTVFKGWWTYRATIQKPFFGKTVIFQSVGVTLKIRSKPLESNQLFQPSNNFSVQMFKICPPKTDQDYIRIIQPLKGMFTSVNITVLGLNKSWC